MTQTAKRTRCALIADDLTGACDAAAPFKLQGASAIACLTADLTWAAEHDVAAVSSDTRDLAPSAVEHHIRAAAVRFAALNPQIVFKKIDSTLRGHVGTEIATALEAFSCEFAVITPAFPRMGRLIRNGHLYVEGDANWTPIDIVKQLETQGLGPCTHTEAGAICEAIERGHRFISVEAACDGALDALVSETFRLGRRVLYAGSAGLAAALAKMVFPHRGHAVPYEPRPLPCIFCIGSDHPVTLAQLGALASERPGRHRIVSITRGQTSCRQIRDLFEPADNFAALVLSGGDTASLVCKGFEVEAIEIEGEIVTGLPWGRFRGGPLNGLPVATKSGGFGRSDALIKVADFFTCQAN